MQTWVAAIALQIREPQIAIRLKPDTHLLLRRQLCQRVQIRLSQFFGVAHNNRAVTERIIGLPFNQFDMGDRFGRAQFGEPHTQWREQLVQLGRQYQTLIDLGNLVAVVLTKAKAHTAIIFIPNAQTRTAAITGIRQGNRRKHTFRFYPAPAF